MPEYLQICLIVCPLVLLAGFVDSVAGGGGLISLPAYMFAGVPVHFALGTNKLSASFGAVISAWRYQRSGFTPWKISVFCAVCALAVGRKNRPSHLYPGSYYVLL